jgi:hypothetical protein
LGREAGRPKLIPKNAASPPGKLAKNGFSVSLYEVKDLALVGKTGGGAAL